MNNRFEHHIRLVPGDASWEKILRRCSAITSVCRMHGSDVKAERRYIGQGVFLRCQTSRKDSAANVEQSVVEKKINRGDG
jgi:hypothetical protein